jgi:hypothetical protein
MGPRKNYIMIHCNDLARKTYTGHNRLNMRLIENLDPVEKHSQWLIPSFEWIKCKALVVRWTCRNSVVHVHVHDRIVFAGERLGKALKRLRTSSLFLDRLQTCSSSVSDLRSGAFCTMLYPRLFLFLAFPQPDFIAVVQQCWYLELRLLRITWCNFRLSTRPLQGQLELSLPACRFPPRSDLQVRLISGDEMDHILLSSTGSAEKIVG